MSRLSTVLLLVILSRGTHSHEDEGNEFGTYLFAERRNDDNLDTSARRSLMSTPCWQMGGICIDDDLCRSQQGRYVTQALGCRDKLNVCCFAWNRFKVKDMREHGIDGPFPWSIQQEAGGRGIVSNEDSSENENEKLSHYKYKYKYKYRYNDKKKDKKDKKDREKDRDKKEREKERDKKEHKHERDKNERAHEKDKKEREKEKIDPKVSHEKTDVIEKIENKIDARPNEDDGGGSKQDSENNDVDTPTHKKRKNLRKLFNLDDEFVSSYDTEKQNANADKYQRSDEILALILINK